MWIVLLGTLVGCITVPVYKEGCEGCDSGVQSWQGDDACETDADCSTAQRCVQGACDYLCTQDADCDGAYACGRPEANHTDTLGCAQRCESDQDCKGGTECDWDGSCL